MSTATNALALAIGAGAGLGAWYVLRGRGEEAPGTAAAPAAPPAPASPAPAPPPAIAPCRLHLDGKALSVNGLPATVGIAVAACKLTGGADLTITKDAPGAVLLELTAALGREGVKVVAQHRNGRRRAARRSSDVAIDLRHFANTVLDVAQGVDEDPTADGRARGRFGRKVFIAAIRRGLKQTGYWRLPRARIDELLVDANRDGLLQLTRADLVGAMDPAEVRASEIQSLGSTFHFVVADRAERNASTYSRFTLRMYPQGSTGNSASRWFTVEPAIPWADARDRLIAAGIVTAETAGRTYAPGGWMLSVDRSQFNAARAEPLP